MTPERWQLVRKIFVECMDLVPAQRLAHLERCSEAAEVKDEVRRLLKEHDDAGSFLEAPVAGVGVASRMHSLCQPGQRLASRFELKALLGRGGMGEVYDAWDKELGESVAIKVLHPELARTAGADQRLRRELQLARRVTHPNVCRLFDFGRHVGAEGELHFLTMERISGQTLSEAMRLRGPMSLGETLALVEQLGAGLDAAHQAGVIHRDFKPANVMLSGERAVIMDFGLARRESLSDASLTSSGKVMGTLDYMAPEQLRGQMVTERTDLYALALIIYEMVTGRRPFPAGDAISAALMRLTEPPVPPRRHVPDLPAAWETALLAALQVDPALRPASAKELIAQLRGDVLAKSTSSPRMERRIVFAAGAGALVAVGGYGAWRYVRTVRPDTRRGVSVLIADAQAPDEVEAPALRLQLERLLGQSGYLRVWDRRRLQVVLSQMGKQEQLTLTAADWREVAAREGVPLVLVPSAVKVSDGMTVVLRLEQVRGNPQESWRPWEQSFAAARPDQMLAALDAGTRWVRELIGEPVEEIAGSSQPAHAVTTPKWDALVEYARAEQAIAKGDPEGALHWLASAVRLDSDFTMAWMRRGDQLVNLGREEEGFRAWKQTLETANRRPLSRREALRFRSMLASDGVDYEAADRLFREYRYQFSDDSYGYFFAAYPALLLNRAEECIQLLQQCLRFEERRPFAHVHLAWAYLTRGDYGSCEHHIQEARRLRAPGLAAYAEASLQHVRGNHEAALESLQIAATDGRAIRQPLPALYRAIVLADSGALEPAVKVLQEGAQTDARAGLTAHQALKLVNAAYLLVDEQETAAVRGALDKAMEVGSGPRLLAQVGSLWARIGDGGKVRLCYDRVPADLDFPRFRLPRLRLAGELAWLEGRIGEAAGHFEAALALEPRIFAPEYWARFQARTAGAAAGIQAYRQVLRYKPFHLRQTMPEPAGLGRRAQSLLTQMGVT